MKALDPHIARGLLTEDASLAWEIIGEELRSLFFTPLQDVNPVENLIRREKTIEPLELLLGGRHGHFGRISQPASHEAALGCWIGGTQATEAKRCWFSTVCPLVKCLCC